MGFDEYYYSTHGANRTNLYERWILLSVILPTVCVRNANKLGRWRGSQDQENKMAAVTRFSLASTVQVRNRQEPSKPV